MSEQGKSTSETYEINDEAAMLRVKAARAQGYEINEADRIVPSVGRIRVSPNIEEDERPSVHTSYSDKHIEIDIWVTGNLPFEALADRAKRGVAEAITPTIAKESE